jgi:hypothetical protein
MSLQAVVYSPGPQTVTANGDSYGGQTANILSFAPHDELRCDLNVTAITGTAPTIQFFVEHTPDGGTSWFSVGNTAVISTAGSAALTLTAKGTANSAFGLSGRLRWAVGGTTPSITFTAFIIGK